MHISEMTIEETIIDLLLQQGYDFIGDDDQWIIDRKLSDFINDEVLLSQLKKINPDVKEGLLVEVIKEIKRIDHPSLFVRNKQFHSMLVDGVTVEDITSDINPLVKLIDFEEPLNNKFQVAHQIKFREFHDTRIPDVLVYINGIPLIIMELKGFEVNISKAKESFNTESRVITSVLIWPAS